MHVSMSLAKIHTRTITSMLWWMAGICLLSSITSAAPERKKPIKKAAKELKQGISQKTKQFQNVSSLQATRKPNNTDLKIQGLREISQKEALLMLENIAEVIARSQATPSRASDIAFLLEQALRKNGYPEAEVSWKISAANATQTIILTAKQGPTRNLGNINVTGIKDELKPEIATYFKHNKSSAFINSNEIIPFIPDNVETSRSNATTYLLAQGYWDATVEVTNQTIRQKSGLVDLDIHVTPGIQYKLAPTEFLGNSPIPLAPLRKKLTQHNQSIANTGNILTIQSEVHHYFTSQGYTQATVTMDKKTTGSHVQLIFSLNIGKKYRIGKVTITGLEHSDPAVLKRRFDRIIGRPYDPDKMILNQRKLISTGAFKSVRINSQPNPDGTIDLTLHMKEGKARGISTYLGAGSFEGFILGFGYHDRNFRGKLQSLALSAEYSGLGILGRASITEPMLFGSDKQLMFSTFILSHEFDGYSKYEFGIGGELIWTITDTYNIRFYSDLLAASVRSNGLPDSALGLQDYGVLRAGIAQKLDFRNNPINPNKGFHGELTAEMGTASGSSENIPYSRFILQTSYRQPLGDHHFFVFSAQTGALFNDDSANFPVDLRFFAGGQNSVRSFPRREMGPTANGNYKGGEAYWVSSIEYNRQVAGPLWTNLFLDAGTISELPSELVNTDAELAIGLGFWLNLPIGPMRAEYGYNLTRDTGEPAGTFHFTIGVSF